MIYEPKTRPFAHQIEALRRAHGQSGFAYLLEMGTGKSKILIDEVGSLFVQGRIDRLLYITAKGNYANFLLRELPAHMSDQVYWRGHLWKNSSNAEERSSLRVMLSSGGEFLRVMVMNIEAISAGKNAYDAALKFVESSDAMVAVDESTLIKSPDSIRTRKCQHLSDVSKYRRIMSGNPSPNSPLDLWSQFEFVERGSLGYRNFYQFRAKYAIMAEVRQGQRMVRIPIGYHDLDDLAERVARRSYRVTKEECLDLPPKIYQLREVAMTDEQTKIYQGLKNDFWARVGDGTVSVGAAIVQLLRMHQVLCGHVRDDDGLVRQIQTHRPSAMMEVIQESSEKTIIWCAYRQDAATVSMHLRDEYGENSVVEYHGGTLPDAREAAINAFQDGAPRFFVGTPQSGGRGLTLTRAGLVIYYSNTSNLEMRLQSEDRAHRIGQTKSVTYVDLMVPGTVDEKIIHALRKKITISEAILQDSPRRWLI